MLIEAFILSGEMTMVLHSDADSRLMHLRAAIAKCTDCINGLDAVEAAAVADSYWDLAIRSRIADHDYTGAWNCIQVAAFGEQAFDGIERISRAHVEGEPVGLIATPTAVMGYVHVLYHAMSHSADGFDSVEQRTPAALPWGPLFQRATRVGALLERQHDIRFHIAAIQTVAIADWIHAKLLERTFIAA